MAGTNCCSSQMRAVYLSSFALVFSLRFTDKCYKSNFPHSRLSLTTACFDSVSRTTSGATRSVAICGFES